jgi:DNA-binding transcriptional MerR regulator
VEPLSPRANGGEHIEPGKLCAADVVEAIPEHLLNVAEQVLGQAEGPDDAGRFRAAMPGDDDRAARTNDPVQLPYRGVEVGPDRHVVHRDQAVDAGVGKTGALGSTEVEPNAAGADGLAIAPPGLVAHVCGRVDALDGRRVGACGEKPDETARAIADFEDVVAGLNSENADHVVLFVVPQHPPACQLAKPAPGVRERVVGRGIEDPKPSMRCHSTTLALQAGLKSNRNMELVTIGDAAQMLALNASALRYYEDRGLIAPERRGGKRMYGREHLRRLAFIQLMQRLGVPLDAASAVLNEPSDQWRGVVREQIAAIDELIARANGARDFLEHALACPADHPVDQCPHMIEGLDKRLEGVTIEELAAQQGQQVPTAS